MEMVSVDRTTVNMRAGPGTQHPATWQLARGFPLEVLERKDDWLRVRDFENDEGWVYQPLVGKKPHFVVKVKSLNIRKAPGTQARIVGKAEYGQLLQTLERREDWVRVRSETGVTGWVASGYLWGW